MTAIIALELLSLMFCRGEKEREWDDAHWWLVTSALKKVTKNDLLRTYH